MWTGLVLWVAQASAPLPMRAVLRDGTPAAGALVRSFVHPPFDATLTELPELRLDADGVATLPTRPDVVEISAHGGRSGFVTLGSGAAVFLELRDEVVVAGRVVDIAGRPVAGASVMARVVEGSTDRGDDRLRVIRTATQLPEVQAVLWPPLPVLSGADGAFQLRLLRGGRYSVTAYGHAESAAWQVVAGTWAGPLCLRLAPDLQVAGVVCDRRGCVVPGAEVRVVSGPVDRLVRADVVGCYRLRLIPDGQLAIAAAHDRLGLGLSELRPVAVTPGQRELRHDPRIDALATFEGVLPEPAAGDGPALALLAAAGDLEHPVVVDADFRVAGRVRVDRLLPGRTYRLRLLGHRVDQLVSVGESGPPTILSAQSRPAWRGRVRVDVHRDDGSVALAVRWWACAAPEPRGLAEWLFTSSQVESGAFDADSSAGARLLICGSDTVPWLSPPVAAPPDGAAPAPLRCVLVVQSMRVAVRRGDHPYPARVTCEHALSDATVLRRQAVTDGDGACRFGAAAGEYQLSAVSQVDGRLLGARRLRWDGRSEVVLAVTP